MCAIHVFIGWRSHFIDYTACSVDILFTFWGLCHCIIYSISFRRLSDSVIIICFILVNGKFRIIFIFRNLNINLFRCCCDLRSSCHLIIGFSFIRDIQRTGSGIIVTGNRKLCLYCSLTNCQCGCITVISNKRSRAAVAYLKDTPIFRLVIFHCNVGNSEFTACFT